ncbi:DUF262 domain-containing protein [Campylobacter coli]|nr:DUF262 domain-containing protein [Campylobacter coli]EIN8285074.1 DUF262 domain-containing protein [Campylobacter coli]
MENNSTNNQNQASVISIESIVNIDDKEQSIFFEIPPYQRLYEWNKEQIQTLLNDIKTKFEENNNEENKEYFIGNVVVSKKNNKNNQQDVKYLLIDGQQRLTTLFLIGFYLSYKIKNPNNDSWKEFIIQGDKLRISMPIREKEEEVLKEFAKFCDEANKDNKSENNLFLQKIKKFPQGICQNIPQALETIVNWFEENIKEENIKKFSDFIYSNVKFIFVELAQNTDLNRFFIRMNNRGKQLEKHEILKARLLKNISDKEERIVYAHIWDICSQMDNYIFQKASDGKISKLKESNENTIDTIINRSFSKPNQDEGKQEKFKSIVDFPTFLLHVYKICNKQDITIDKNKLLEIIKIEDSGKAKAFIENLLKYRILFDYFIVKGKDDKENSYRIRRLDKEGEKLDKDFDDLAMVQNYLRVARSGMSNNHHHWLTPFLKFINNDKLKISYERGNNEDKPEELQIKIGDYNITTNFQNFLNTLNPEELIEFLENLDTALAKEQASAEEIKKDLLDISNAILDQLKIENDQIDTENIFFIEDENSISELDRGTATPHYWFYRLEYYLWKYSKDEKILKEMHLDEKKFIDIASNFYFRNLNSIEHVQAQSKANEKDWDDENIDNFGNLALISSSFNSSLSNQDTQDKYLDLQKYINKDNNVISLKLWLIYALSEKNQLNWTFNKAQEHRRQMLEILKKSFNNEQDKA